MPEPSHAFLINLLSAYDCAAAHGCGLEPQLLELLLDRHSVPVGAVGLDQRIRSDGPEQSVPEDWPRIGAPNDTTGESAHVRR
ncbi:MAG: hypothetical protein ACXIUW_10960 [Roseinatronobacter sp.]